MMHAATGGVKVSDNSISVRALRCSLVRYVRTAKQATQTARPTLHSAFLRDVARVLLEYKLYSVAVLALTAVQEFTGLWRVTLLGQFIDRLDSGALGYVVWLFLAASLLHPGLVRANIVLRHKMFYETDFRRRVEWVLEVADKRASGGSEEAGAAYERTVNAVGGITNTVYHVLGSFTPVIITVVMVAGRLLSYNRLLGMLYLVTLVIPAGMTVVFNRSLESLRDLQYSVISEATGTGITAISGNDVEKRAQFQRVMQTRKGILVSLVAKTQGFLHAREATLIGSQFLIVFLALGMRDQLGITPGGFAEIIGYTVQVAAAFTTAVACLDDISSWSRAYHVYASAASRCPST